MKTGKILKKCKKRNICILEFQGFWSKKQNFLNCQKLLDWFKYYGKEEEKNANYERVIFLKKKQGSTDTNCSSKILQLEISTRDERLLLFLKWLKNRLASFGAEGREVGIWKNIRRKRLFARHNSSYSNNNNNNNNNNATVDWITKGLLKQTDGHFTTRSPGTASDATLSN